MRVTVFGATGLLGKALTRIWTDDDLSGLGSKDRDMRDPKQVSNVLERARTDWIVLAAAYTDVDGCEQNREHAFDFFFSSRRRHTRFDCDWSSDVCSSD